MIERENLPTQIVSQDVVVTTQRGSLVVRGLQAVEKSKQKALTKNNDVNTAEEQYRLGLKYDSGDGVPQDYAEAARWYRLSADQGYAKAQYNLGSMYDNGQGVEKSDEQAVYWFRKVSDSDSKMLSLIQWLRTLPPGGKLTVAMPGLPSTKITSKTNKTNND